MPRWLETKQQRSEFVADAIVCSGLGLFFGAVWTAIVSVIWGWNQNYPNAKDANWLNSISYGHAYWYISVWMLCIVGSLATIAGLIAGVCWLVNKWINSGADKPKSEVEADVVREAVRNA